MRRSSALALLATALALLGPAACAHRTSTPEIDPTLVACSSFAVIAYSRQHDTDETIRQIQEHNAVYEALCVSGPR